MLTQAIAYKGIIKIKNPPDRPSTTRNIQATRNAIGQYTNTLETDETIWTNMRRKELRTKVQQFLYKAMHETQKVGPFWENINNFEDRQRQTKLQNVQGSGVHGTHPNDLPHNSKKNNLGPSGTLLAPNQIQMARNQPRNNPRMWQHPSPTNQHKRKRKPEEPDTTTKEQE
jgi:hypothetical protein